MLPYGRGRSYGDCCLNDGGTLIDTSRLCRVLAFDRERGVIRCEAGVTFADLLDVAVPQGWFPPVTPGTKFVSLGGALANDIHGKNHHVAGTFGRHVERFELLRSDGSRLECSPEEHPELFAATIGGLGLTGLVTWLDLRLKRVPGPAISAERVRFGGLDDFFALTKESDGRHEYTVAWIDTMAPARARGRGVFFRGDHADEEVQRSRGFSPSVPFDMPAWLLSPTAIRAFNETYWRLPGRKQTMRYDRFFYPLDSLGEWRRLYGSAGFLQYQFVLPFDAASQGVREVLDRAAERGLASFLSVLKVFGTLPSPGLLSFPAPGVTFAMDVRNGGPATFDALATLDEIVLACGGRSYPAKDARMEGVTFRKMYPKWEELARLKDPKFSSSFWRRVTV